MRIAKFMLLCFLCVTSFAFAQEKTITGQVLDDNEIPLPGANVVVKNSTTRATVTDFDGNFTIQVNPEDVLVFSYVGYLSKEITVGAQTNMVVSLELDTQALDEVVVVGYGTQKKSVVTGAISSVKAEDLENLPITRVEQSIQGRTSGVTISANSGQPGSSSTIRIRGITSLNNNEPLWVVDGVVVDAGGIGYLNQADIESIEVLKDAASQAIYGARAATGVILITTKKGKSGKMTVNYNGYAGMSSPARELDLLNGEQYATLMNEASVAAGGNLLFDDPASYGKGTDWQDVIFNDSAQRIGQEISLSGGNDVSTFYASFGLQEQEGIVMSDISQYSRKNIRLNSTHKISKSITFGQTAGYSREKVIGIGNTNSEFGGPLASAINLDPLTPIVITDPAKAGQAPYTQPGIWRDANGNPYAISEYVGQEMTNPLAYQETRRGNYSWSDNFVGNAYVEIEFIEGLKARSTLGGKLAYWGDEYFNPVSYLNAFNIRPLNNIGRSTNQGFGWNLENTITYAKQFGKHDLSVLVGQGVYVDNITKGSSVVYTDIPVDSWEDASFNFDVPTDQINASAYENQEHRVTSLFSRINYNYDERYIFTGIIRRDGSSRFGSNNKYGYFPSFSLGWVLTNESFWNESEIVNQFKIRGGYGVTGSDAIGDFRYLSTIGGGRNYTIGTSGSVTIGNSPNAPSNPDLKWEETSQANIGFDARFFQRFSMVLDLYNKKTTGILRDVRIPGYVGATGNPVGNVADMVNKGVDFELGYNNTFGDFDLSVNGNVSYLENEITYLGDNIEYLSGGETFQSSTYPITRTQVGEPYGSFYGFKTNGIFQTQEEINNYVGPDGSPIQPNAVPGDFKWVDTDGDGQITSDDRDFIGSSIPKFTYGFTINMNYKNFDFMIFAQGAAGNKIFQGLRRLDIQYANFQTTAMGRWTGAGTSNDFPRLTLNDTNLNFSNPSDFYLEDGDYLRFKTIQLGYTIPADAISKVGLHKVRLYVTGENLLTFTKYTGFDPEIGGGVLGIDRGFYPQAKTGMLGINVQF
ncbi:SusC/RagA family TonB-linked outer membrane protein [Robertkochia solimangrovi]|uniref:SusC/RagA family TonB-linked outer membrane protein n=1 Tax=Robertkochia solimangrovi TaxID=2213046 RepID=UPI00117EED37|nr:TonB-dependent receptor [Robertkochia solimangrovi]TRZ44470.1 SusC/RagA family TonB-linked outer membrane protein [Robertkochia solimangrovi]